MTQATSRAVADTGIPAIIGTRVLKRRFARTFLYLMLALAAAFFLAPLYVMVITSFKPLDEIRNGGILALPLEGTFDAWKSAWGSACIGLKCGGLQGYFGNSFLITIPAVLGSVVVGALNGYALTKWSFKGANILFVLLIVGNFIPYQVVLLPLARSFSFFGLYGTMEGLILIHVIYGIPITTMLFRNFFISIPNDLIKAARIDGAGFFWILFRIVLPMSPSVIVVALIFQFTGIWNDFLFGVSFASPENAPVTVALNNLVNSNFGVREYNIHMAATMIAATPTLLLYIFLGRFFLRGVAAGAVKG